jgi:hypothetical protein
MKNRTSCNKQIREEMFCKSISNLRFFTIAFICQFAMFKTANGQAVLAKVSAKAKVVFIDNANIDANDISSWSPYTKTVRVLLLVTPNDQIRPYLCENYIVATMPMDTIKTKVKNIKIGEQRFFDFEISPPPGQPKAYKYAPCGTPLLNIGDYQFYITK